MQASRDHLPATAPTDLVEVLRRAAQAVPNNAAILAPGRPDLNFAALLEHVEHIVGVLNGFGLKRGSRVAIVMPNGPEAAAAMTAVACGCTVVPLNAEYRAEEFDYFLRQARAEAVIVAQTLASPVRDVAQALDIRVIELISSPEQPAGMFVLEGGQYMPPAFAQPDDTLLLLPTSGTTDWSKLVIFKHQLVSLYYDARRQFMFGTPENPRITLNMLPLIHIAGVANIIGGLVFYSGVVCHAGFTVKDFYTSLDTYHPASFSAIPAMLKLIVEAAPDYDEIIQRSSLKMILSGSASLPVETADALQRLFRVPVVITYGMSEIGSIAWQSSAYPQAFKAGSVGKPSVETAIMADDGTLLPAGESGEVVVRGEHIFFGYEGDPDAQNRLFGHGWFHTGDLGYLDEENYLFITGRVKEIINRGGEKISPYEVEEVLKRYPGVREASVFGVPHLVLGEDLGAAVVVDDPVVTPKALRQYLAQNVAPQKVPGIIVIVDEIPKTPTGKVQRARLPHLLELVQPDGTARLSRHALHVAAPTPPRSDTERRLRAIWTTILGTDEIGIHDDFFDLGGTSLQAALLVLQIGKTFGFTLPLSALFEVSTIAELAEVVARPESGHFADTRVALQPLGDKPPIFCVPGYSGQLISFHDLAQRIGVDQPVYGLQPPGIDGVTPALDRMDALAAHFVGAMRSVQPTGPYVLGGYSFGGLVALEMAHLLDAQGERVALLAIFDSSLDMNINPELQSKTLYERIVPRVQHHLSQLNALDMPGKLQYVSGAFERHKTRRVRLKVEREQELLPGVQAIREGNRQALTGYQPRPYHQPVVYFSAQAGRVASHVHAFETAWGQLVEGGLEICEVPGTHRTMMHEPHVQVLAAKLREYIERALVGAVPG